MIQWAVPFDSLASCFSSSRTLPILVVTASLTSFSCFSPPQTRDTDTASDSGSSGNGNELCGNGVIDDGEECDLGPGNSDSGSCTSVCLLAVCGDNLHFLDEEDCDEGGETATCDANCTAVECGDGDHNAAAGEQCDGGGESADCNADCTLAECGDGVINLTAGESCEGEDGTNATCVSCALECNAGFDDCNGDVVADGCETDLGDLSNCGGCGVECDGFPLCGEGGCARFAFVTGTLTDGNIGGIEGANSMCQTLATDAGLPGTYLAWLSSDAGGSPADNFTQEGGPWVLVDGSVVANDWDDLTDGSIGTAIDLTATGDPAPESVGNGCGINAVWTNTAANGTMSSADSDCSDWTMANTDPSVWGSWTQTNSGWTTDCSAGDGCDWQASIMCFQQ